MPICTSLATVSDVKTRQEGKAVMRKRLKTPWAAPPLPSTSDVVSLSAIRAGGRGVVVGLSGLASFIPAQNASRLTVREVLAYE